MDHEILLKKAEEYVKTYLQQDNSCYCFHDDGHTESVVEAAREIGLHYNLSAEELFIVLTAAFFHDTGYLNGGAENHEQRSAKLAGDFLKEKGVNATIVAEIQACILATKIPQTPQNLLQQIVCDADLFHLGSEDFISRDKLLRQEVETVLGKEFDKRLWRKGTITFLKNHNYHTTYAQQKLNPGKEKNIKDLETKEMDEKGMKSKKKNDKGNMPDRGIETMFRITATNNQRLSDMADNKANILITVNSIILSVVIALLLRKLDNNAYLIAPTLILLLVSLVTMVVAILATRPKISAGYFTKQEVESKQANLLFFGNFHKMDLKDYQDGMLKAMGDREYLYGMLIKDVYSQGVVLGRKYRLLRHAYNIFMYGIIVSVLVFTFAVYTL